MSETFRMTGKLRWLVSPHTSTEGPKLQYEVAEQITGWGEPYEEFHWRDVETFVSKAPTPSPGGGRG